ncbi:hypothetical protein ACIQCD_04935 [Streptomyces sp. NPDC093250]|uniref:hypothetical protein n=1 Tax=Streptomyces sp. NPDC093250 TaxID=3366036 RepID=UPI00381370A2
MTGDTRAAPFDAAAVSASGDGGWMEQLAEVGAQDGQDGICCALTDRTLAARP